MVQYRDQILPLISLSSVLDSATDDTTTSRDPVQVIVFGNEERAIGLLVDEILDITESVVTCRQPATHSALLGSAVVGEKVNDFLDLHAVLAHAGGRYDDAAPAGKSATILLAENSRFSRALLRSGIEMAGYRVIESADAAEALRDVESHRPDVLVVSQTLPHPGALSLIQQVRLRNGFEHLPALTLSTTGAECNLSPGGEFDETVSGCSIGTRRSSLCAALSQLLADPDSGNRRGKQAKDEPRNRAQPLCNLYGRRHVLWNRRPQRAGSPAASRP